MIAVESQVHGYRHGHQLLAGSVQLPREDQSTIDQLSDVAGPLRPRERFEPYLTGYPLPSGGHYVLARTWQDLTATRAGCVRTLSLIIPIVEWATADSLSPLLDLLQLNRLPEDCDAKRSALQPRSVETLPPAPDFMGSELLEALLLEDVQPVVVFDSPSPELVSVRLLTALWPSIRRQFAVSTFALSPRKVDGREFDLLFAPKGAKTKFSDWNGRRIDGRLPLNARHRWTEEIVNHVFNAPNPRLLSFVEEGLVTDHGNARDDTAAFRIALLWDELIEKLESTPTAALGLLDIANSGKVRRSFALTALEPSLINAVRRAPLTLPEDEAWIFLGAIARKLHDNSISGGTQAIDAAISDFAERSPEGAVSLLSRSDERGVLRRLIPIIANGIGNGFTDRAARALLSAPPEVLGTLVAGSAQLAESVAHDLPLIDRFGEILPHLHDPLLGSLSDELLPHLVFDWQLPAAAPLVERLGRKQVAAQVRHLGLANDFAASKLAEVCLQHAHEIGASREVLSALSGLPASERRDDMIARTLEPSVKDAAWLLRNSGLPDDIVSGLLADLLKRADDLQLGAILTDDQVGAEIVNISARASPELLQRIIFMDDVALEVLVSIVRSAFADANANERAKFAEISLQRCLGTHFSGDELAFISAMLGSLGKQLDGSRAVVLGFGRAVPASVASRNAVAFHMATQPARLQVVLAIVDVAQALRDRRDFDLDESGADACAQLLLDAEKAAPHSALSAAGLLLPTLMRQRKKPVSSIIAATFPMIYRQMAKKSDTPNALVLASFFTWDRRKAAREELVAAFISSDWAPGNLALTACRCSEVQKMFGSVAKAYRGEIYLSRVASDLARVPSECRKSVEKIITSLCSNGA